MIVSLKEDGEYYRVIICHGTHTLHSEKLNLATAFKIGCVVRDEIKNGTK